MDILKPTSVSSDSPKQPNTGRRSFMWKTAAAMSAVFASAVAGISKTRTGQDAGLKDQVARLSHQIASLEDANSIRRLHRLYESRLDRGMYEEVVDMFADNGEVIFNGGVFAGKNKGIRRLYCGRFKSGLTGKKIEPAPGFEPGSAEQQDIVEVAPDRLSAKARFAYSMQVGAPIISDLTLVKMARLQGEGILKWWEGGIHEVSYVKSGDSWKIRRLEYRATSKANYTPGRSYAKPIDVPAFSKTYPADPTGPDKLVTPA
jgi:hypothetical protein